jgi:hypothetical protein
MIIHGEFHLTRKKLKNKQMKCQKIDDIILSNLLKYIFD